MKACTTAPGSLWLPAMLLLLFLVLTPLVRAQEQAQAVPSSRGGGAIAVYWQVVPKAQATVLLMPGGAGGFGSIDGNGRPTGGNFLVRSTALFAAAGFNVAIMGRPDDVRDLSYEWRTRPEHLADMRQVLDWLRQRSEAPLWLVGTSRGTISAALAAIDQQQAIAGLVLSSSIVSGSKPGMLGTLALERIRVPVLLLHHARDACALCRPEALPAVLEQLSASRLRELALVDGGAGAQGDVCGAQHWHGYIGMEAEAVQRIAAFIARAGSSPSALSR